MFHGNRTTNKIFIFRSLLIWHPQILKCCHSWGSSTYYRIIPVKITKLLLDLYALEMCCLKTCISLTYWNFTWYVNKIFFSSKKCGWISCFLYVRSQVEISARKQLMAKILRGFLSPPMRIPSFHLRHKSSFHIFIIRYFLIILSLITTIRATNCVIRKKIVFYQFSVGLHCLKLAVIRRKLKVLLLTN
jgi:hypothetical protein